MASGDRWRTVVAGTLFMFAVLVDHMDGEFARLTKLTSRFGHYYDHVAAAVGYVSLFVGLGIGLRSGWLDAWAPVAGGVAAGSIAAIFLIRVFLEETAGRAMVAQGNWHGFEPEDALYLVGPVAWLGPVTLSPRGGRWRAAVPPLGGVVRGRSAIRHGAGARRPARRLNRPESSRSMSSPWPRPCGAGAPSFLSPGRTSSHSHPSGRAPMRHDLRTGEDDGHPGG